VDGGLIGRAGERTDILDGLESVAASRGGNAGEEIMHQAPRRTLVRGLLMAVMLLAIMGPTQANLLSKTYQFKQDVALTVGEGNDAGLRLDSVRFRLPAPVDGRLQRTSGVATVEVAVSNTSESSQKVGVALALFDEQGRLVGVASGGSRVRGLKSGRQKTYKLVFDDVNAELFETKTFQVSLETKP